MGFAKKNYSSAPRKEDLPKITLLNPAISGAKLISDSCIVFTLNVDGASFYNLRVIYGKNGHFIGMPQSKGGDGKYYDMYRLYFAVEDERAIIDTVISHYAGLDEKADYKTRYEVK